MKTRKLGSKGPEISVVGFGAWEMGGAHWGPNPDEKVLGDAVRAGIDAGMNWIDTAEVYGNGTSEEILGRAVGTTDVMLFTKVAPKAPGTGFAPQQVKEACEKSLTRLQRTSIDLFQLHWPDANEALEDTWGAMGALVDEGKVRWIGVSNFNDELIDRCEKVRHVDSLQPQFSLLTQEPSRGWIEHCARNGTGVITYGPLAYGLLTGAITMQTEFGDTDWRSGKMGMGNYEKLFAPEARARHLQTLDELRPIADRLGISLSQLALAWNFQQKGVTGAIAGSRSPKHTAENAAAGDIVLGEKDLEEIGSVVS